MNVDFSQGALDSFNMGKQAGTANSRVSSIGMAIRGMLQDARAKGLFKAQSMYQTEGADQLAQLKEGREEERRSLPATTIFAGATKDQDRTIEHTRGDTVKAAPKEDATAAMLAALFGKPGGGDGETTVADATGGGNQNTDGDSVTIEFNDGTTETMTRAAAKAAGYIQ